MIASIQYLRGIAAILVVYHHTDYQLSKLAGSEPLPLGSIGASGVDIFFVISGFIMWVTTCKAPPTAADFLYRRIIRITPLYWTLTLLLAFLALYVPSLMKTTQFNVEHLAASLFYIPVPHPVLSDEILPFFIQGWTLNYEMFFYLIFALCIGLPAAWRFTCMLALLSLLALGGYLFAPQNAILKFYTSALVLEFGFGIVVGALYLARPSLPKWAAAGLVCLGIAGLVGAGLAEIGFGPNGFLPSRAFAWGLPAAAIVAGAALAKGQLAGWAHRFWTELGNSSYSLYLSHLLVLPAISIVWRHAGLGTSPIETCLFVAVSLIAAALVGQIVYMLVEQQLARLFRNRQTSTPRRPPALKPVPSGRTPWRM